MSIGTELDSSSSLVRWDRTTVVVVLEVVLLVVTGLVLVLFVDFLEIFSCELAVDAQEVNEAPGDYPQLSVSRSDGRAGE